MQIQDFYTQYFTPEAITTDSRKIKTGDVFIALKGDRFNGNKFALQALSDGAKVAVVDEPVDEDNPQIVQVENCLSFLQELAKYHIANSSFEVIGLTGSNGKTTTKELLFSVLKEKFNVQATAGNLNNHIGVPLTALTLHNNIDYAIIEMGANHVGEIAELCQIAQPTRGVITNIGHAHLEGFGGYEGVKKAKGELYDFLKQTQGKVYVNAADSVLTELLADYSNRCTYNSVDGNCQGDILQSSPTLSIRLNAGANSLTVASQLFGDYNLINMLTAACIGLDLGMTLEQIQKGLESYTPGNLRSQILKLGDATLILDCYNANPSSMKLAINEFSKMHSGIRIAILGGMKELGMYSLEEHQRIAHQVASEGIEHALFLGEEFQQVKNLPGKLCLSHDEIREWINENTLCEASILIKGSRSNQLEEIGDYLKSKLG